ncbi:MAG: sugar transferase [Dorea sp.]|nr:sugar transferase [Dorea sp.]
MRKVKRILDEFLAAMSLIILSPVMVIAAVGIKLSSKGTVFYKAKRMGKDLKQITVYKFRTMYMGSDKKSMITAVNDNRIFAWGEILRKTKIDELPQLLNVLEGSMSIIGPRPEDISIVDNYFTDEEKKTLDVLPGLASPGSIFNYTHGDLYLKGNNANEVYVKEFLHIKLALDLYYLSHWSLWYDMKIIVRTLYTIVMMSFTSKQLGYPVEYKKVFRLSVFSEEK